MKEDLMEEIDMNPKEKVNVEKNEETKEDVLEKNDKLEISENDMEDNSRIAENTDIKNDDDEKIEKQKESQKRKDKKDELDQAEIDTKSSKKHSDKKEDSKIDENINKEESKKENKKKSRKKDKKNISDAEQENKGEEEIDNENKTEKNKKVKNKRKNEKLNNGKKAKEKKKIDKKQLKKIIISIIIVFVVALFFSTVFALTNINNEKIISGVNIEGIEVSGLSKEEAKAKIETAYSEKLEQNIELKYQDFASELNPTLMEVKYDIESAVNQAYSLGRESNIFVNNYNILGTLIGKRDIDVNMSINEDVTKKTIEDIGTNLPGILTQSSYSIEEDKLIITRGKEGIVINTDELLSEVKDVLNDINVKDVTMEIPVETKTPEDIDIDKIHSEVYKEVKDAYYTKDPFTVYPEVEGVDFDVEKAKEIISAEVKDEYVIDLIITKPKVTIDQIGTEAFPDQLATFTTRYDASDKDRTTNLVLACQKINGKVIMPGATFSYNEALGPRTASAGYKNAKIYSSGEVIDGIGGGICQISSTLYNSALMSDMEIVERRNHQFVTSYVGAGRDATVVYGSTDFKFKNTRTYPVKIVASAKSGIATVSIYGIKEADREYTYSFSTKTISTIPYTTKYVEDSSLAPGKEVVKQKGANGLVTQTYMTKMLNGKVISTKLLSKDTYSAMQRIIRRGTSKASSSSTQTPTTTPNTPSTSTDNSGTTSTPQEPTQPQTKPEETTPTETPQTETTE